MRVKQIEIVAEVGNTHEGSVGLAKCFVRSAASCGVNTVKFQTHLFNCESLPDAPNPPYFEDESRETYLDRTSFSLAEWTELRRFAEEECGVAFLCSPFSLEAVDLLEEAGLSAYKVASGEVTNLPLLRRLSLTGKPVLLSSGMSSWAELDRAVEALRDNGTKDLTLLQCTSKYPCPPEDTGLGIMMNMRERYGLPVGFSDHTLGISVPIAAAALGACVIEKHFTLSKEMYGPDAQFSATPDEMKGLVQAIREVEVALNSELDKDAVAMSLADMKRTFEKSIVTACAITKGTVLGETHLAFKKPGDGISAQQLSEVIGRRTLLDIAPNTKLDWTMLTGEAE